MTENEKEILIDKLLVFLNDELESNGQSIKIIQFHLQETGADAKKFLETHSHYTYQALTLCLNACLTREYLIHLSMGDKYRVGLSLKGQGRAHSVKLAKNTRQTTGSNISIGTFNANSPTQIGDHNSQNIENILTSIIENINNMNVCEKEKEEAKGLLKRALEHPLVSAAVGAVAGAITEKYLGG